MAQTHEGGRADTHGRWNAAHWACPAVAAVAAVALAADGRARLRRRGALWMTGVAGSSGSDVDDRESQIVTSAPGHSGKPRESQQKGYCRHQSCTLQAKITPPGWEICSTSPCALLSVCFRRGPSETSLVHAPRGGRSLIVSDGRRRGIDELHVRRAWCDRGRCTVRHSSVNLYLLVTFDAINWRCSCTRLNEICSDAAARHPAALLSHWQC